MDIKNIAILFSGTGSNFAALIHAFETHPTIRIVVALTNNPHAKGIEYAHNANIPLEILDHREFSSREEYDKKIVEKLAPYALDLVVLAGFMRILTPIFTRSFNAINLHPSLLPLFKGKEAIKSSFESGMKVGGVTVHRVNEELDGGEILAQGCVPIYPYDTLESYTTRIQCLEHTLLPQTILTLWEKP